MRTNADMTIYNKVFDKATRMDKYQRTTLYGVFWDESKAYNRLQSGLESADKVFIVVPFSTPAEREYISPKEFEKLDDTTDYFTIREEDRVVKGRIDLEIDKSTDLDREFEAFTITSVDTKDFGSFHMQHWELGCS